MRRLVLFSGMGGDPRLFTGLKLEGVEVLMPPHLLPLKGESLRDYALRSADAAGVKEDDIVGGQSFGGMIAAEVAANRKVSGLIMLASTFETKYLPPAFRLMELVCRPLPDFMLRIRSWRWFIKLRFWPISEPVADILSAIGRDVPAVFLRRQGRMIAQWNGVARPACPVLEVHGETDLVIRHGPGGTVIPHAGHVFTLTHPDLTNAALQDFLRSSAPQPRR